MRPMIKTKYTPAEIIGQNEGMLKAHFILSKNTNTENFDSKINKSFTRGERQIIADLYENLRHRGYYVSDICRDKLIFSRLMTECGMEFVYIDGGFVDANAKTPTPAEIIKMREAVKLEIKTVPDVSEFDMF